VDASAREHEPAPDRGDEAAPSPQFRHPPSRCPYCHDACGEDDDVAVCRRCLARHHTECWNAADACGTCKGERVLIEIGNPPEARRAAHRRYVEAVGREPRWLRLGLGVVFIIMMIAAALLGVFVLYRAFTKPFQSPGEWLFLLPFSLGLVSIFPALLFWRAARLRLWPIPEPEPEINQAIDAKDKPGAD
jgi:hypothetical protein